MVIPAQVNNTPRLTSWQVRKGKFSCWCKFSSTFVSSLGKTSKNVVEMLPNIQLAPFLSWNAAKHPFLQRGSSQKEQRKVVSTERPLPGVFRLWKAHSLHTFFLPSIFTSSWCVICSKGIGFVHSFDFLPTLCFLEVNPSRSCSATSIRNIRWSYPFGGGGRLSDFV